MIHLLFSLLNQTHRPQLLLAQVWNEIQHENGLSFSEETICIFSWFPKNQWVLHWKVWFHLCPWVLNMQENLIFCFLGVLRKQRYVYGIGTFLDGISKVTGIIKFDLHAEAETSKTMLQIGGNIKGIYKMGHGIYGSDPIYVPRETAEEDDGYLIFFVHDENTGYSAYLLTCMLPYRFCICFFLCLCWTII